jgi:hypothetical protein
MSGWTSPFMILAYGCFAAAAVCAGYLVQAIREYVLHRRASRLLCALREEHREP